MHSKGMRIRGIELGNEAEKIIRIKRYFALRIRNKKRKICKKRIRI